MVSYISLWWNHKFLSLYRGHEICTEGKSEHTNLRFQELLKLQLRVIGIWDIEGTKPKVHLLD